DVGTVINPQIVEAQVQGGVVQGISNCLFEQFVYDENGQQLTSNFENYKLATAADVPSIEVHHEAGTPCPHTPLGSRGLGEGIPPPRGRAPSPRPPAPRSSPPGSKSTSCRCVRIGYVARCRRQARRPRIESSHIGASLRQPSLGGELQS